MTEGPLSNVVSLAAKREPDNAKGCKDALDLAAKETFTDILIAGWVEGGQLVWFHHGDLTGINYMVDQVKSEVINEIEIEGD